LLLWVSCHRNFVTVVYHRNSVITRLKDLIKGRINKFSLDALMNFVSAARLEVRIAVTERAA
jgi:hypothetical protein